MKRLTWLLLGAALVITAGCASSTPSAPPSVDVDRELGRDVGLRVVERGERHRAARPQADREHGDGADESRAGGPRPGP